jgi:hypothetical protein
LPISVLIIRYLICLYGNVSEAGTAVKSGIPNGSNAGWYSYAGKAGALVKSLIPNAGKIGVGR